MRMTLNLDARLLRDAMRMTNARTKSEVVRRGLQELINSTNRRARHPDLPMGKLTRIKDTLPPPERLAGALKPRASKHARYSRTRA